MSTKITRDMTFHQILQLDSRVAGVLGEFNLGCVGCMGAMNETLEQGAMAHGLDVEDILTALNGLFTE